MIRGIGFKLLGVLQFLFLNFSIAQIKNEIGAEQIAVYNAASVYFQSLGEQSGIYRGTEYTGYPYKLKSGHQFFESADISYGSVYYDGVLYETVPMRYDIIKDQEVVRYVDQVSGISLHNEKIDYFSVHNHHFIHFKKDILNSPTIPPGFYDRVYNGGIVVLVNRSKGTLKEVSIEGNFITILKQRNNFFLQKGGIYYSVESLGSVLKVLGTNHKEVLDDLKRSKIKFRKNPENAIVHMVRYYDQLGTVK